MTNVIINLPLWQLGVVLVGGWTVLAVLGALLTRPWFRKHIPQTDAAVTAQMVNRVATAYALVASFLLVGVWNQLSSARSITTQEAAALVAAYQDSRSFPTQDRQAIELALRRYVQIVVSDEWPAMAHGQASTPARIAFSHVFGTYSRLHLPAHYSAPYAALLTELNTALSLRDQRIDASGETLPEAFWILLIGGGFMVTVSTFFTYLSDQASHVLLTAAVAAMTSIIIFLIVAINYPFSGAVSIPPDTIGHVLRVFDEINRYG